MSCDRSGRAAENLRATSAACRLPPGWQAMLEAMPDAVWLVDAQDLRVVAINRGAAALALGDRPQAAEVPPPPENDEQGVRTTHERLEALGRPVGALFASPEDACFWDEVAAGTGTGDIDSETLVLRDGQAVPVVRRVRRVEAPAGAGAFYLVSVRDRSDELRLQRALDVAIADLSATLESTHDGLLVTDLAGRLRNFNRRFAALWELPPALTARRDDDAVLDWMRRAVIDPPAYMRRLAQLDEAVLAESTDLLLLRSGKVVERIMRPQLAHGQPIGRIASFRDITTTMDAQQRLDTLSDTDAVTGLPNRRLLTDRLEQSLAMARRDGTRFGLLFIHLAGVAGVDAAIGRVAGDRVLLEVAERVKACLRRVDTVARIGADEFVVLAHQADPGGAEMAALRLIDALTAPIRQGGTTVDLAASLGIALCPRDGLGTDDLFRAAEAAMREAKAAGGGLRFAAAAPAAPAGLGPASSA